MANKALRGAGVTWGAALQRTSTAAQRAGVAGRMELAATGLGSKVLGRIARQMLLDSAGAVLGIYASYVSSVVRELIVWVVEEKS